MLFYYIAITEAGKAGDPLTVDFFKEEYTLNYTIGKENIVYVSDSGREIWALKIEEAGHKLHLTIDNVDTG